MNVIESHINNAEVFLSKVAVCPGIGIAAGCVKVVIGVIQIVSSIFLLIGAAFLHHTANGRMLYKASMIHIKHGMGNVVAGVLEAIPGIGTAIYMIRQRERDFAKQVYIKTHHEDKFMPYSSLVGEDWKFDGDSGSDGLISLAEAIFEMMRWGEGEGGCERFYLLDTAKLACDMTTYPNLLNREFFPEPPSGKKADTAKNNEVPFVAKRIDAATIKK